MKTENEKEECFMRKFFEKVMTVICNRRGCIMLSDVKVPSGENYDLHIEQSIRRRSEFKVSEGKLYVCRDYDIDGKRYVVRSVFNTDEEKRFEDGIRHLIDTEYDKNS